MVVLSGPGTQECYNEIVRDLKRNIESGFTMIELLLVMGIIAILSVISFSSFMASLSKGRDTTRKSDINQLRKALEVFNGHFGTYPVSDPDHAIVGCLNSAPADPKDPTFLACPAANGGFSYYVNGFEETNLAKFPRDPDSSRIYYYQSDGETYSLYAALENLNDKDVKQTGTGTVDPAGWAINCGSAVCNYKITNAGLEVK